MDKAQVSFDHPPSGFQIGEIRWFPPLISPIYTISPKIISYESGRGSSGLLRIYLHPYTATEYV